MDIMRNFIGYCPYLKKDHELTVQYIEVSSIGMAQEFKINSYDCTENEDDSCPYAQQNNCPIYEKIPVTIEK